MTIPLLSIYIPTYNRPTELLELLECLKNERNKLDSPRAVEIIVSDNASEKCIKSTVPDSHYDIWIRNTRNIGADANILLSMERCTGRYLWCIGDDDLIKDGALAKILACLSNPELSRCSLFYLNATVVKMNDEILIERVVAEISQGIHKSHEAFEVIGGNLLTLSTFILSNMHFTKTKDSLAFRYGRSYLCSPLCMSLDALSGGDAYIFNEPLVIYRDNARPWINQWTNIDLFYRPFIMHTHAKTNYPKAGKNIFFVDASRYVNLLCSIFKRDSIPSKIKLTCLLQYASNRSFHYQTLRHALRGVKKIGKFLWRQN